MFIMAILFKTTLIVLFFCFGFCYQLNGNDGCTEMEAREGDTVTLRCNATKTFDIIQFVWEMPNENSTIGQNITIINLTKADIGLYTCYAQYSNGSLPVNVICLNVYGPEAKIVWVNVTTPSLQDGQNFSMEFAVDGKPDPMTLFTNMDTNITVANFTGRGNYTIIINDISCIEGGNYNLSTSNTVGKDFNVIPINVTGRARPNPAYHGSHTQTPRIGQNVSLEAHVLGCPEPTYTWSHNDKNVTHTDIPLLTLAVIQVKSYDDFGEYILEMDNEYGKSYEVFTLLAEGPPDTPTGFKVTNVTKSNATLNWKTGYDYNRAQTFIIYQHSEANSTVYHEQNDTSDGHGNTQVEYSINELTADMIYNLTIVSKNSNGTSPPSDVLVFSPYGKPTIDPKEDVKLIIESRLYEPVSLEMHAIGYPPPSYAWVHENQKLTSSDQTYSSAVTITSMTVKDYGNYTLNMTNEVGSSIYTFFVAAYGPPESPKNFVVVDIGAKNVTLSWVTGYDYNDTQTFFIRRIVDGEMTDFRSYPDKSGDQGNTTVTQTIDDLVEGTEYNLTIFSQNKNGSSPVHNYLQFITFETPKMDPTNPTKLKFTPRTKETIHLVMHAVGNPSPIFIWEHKGVRLNSSDENSTSTVTIHNISAEDFGNYTLTMSNKVGRSVYTYVLDADGPPDPVSKLNVTDIRKSSSILSLLTGFDYESNQTFMVYNYSEGDIEQLAEVPDNSSDTGGKRLQLVLPNLSPRTFYNITVRSINARGATDATEFSPFTTFGEPIPDPSKPLNDTTSPRLGETSAFTLHWLANPDPTIMWAHNNKTLNHNETGMTTRIEIANINVTSFGDYNLTMNNSYGVYTHIFRINADGPPASISFLNITNITTSNAVLKFQPGFNYNNTQTFAILQSINNKWTVLDANIKDNTDGTGGKMQTYMLQNLHDGFEYTIMMQSNNSKGSTNSTGNLTFSTKAPASQTAEIAGGVAGGVAGLILIIIIFFVMRMRRGRPEEEEEPLNQQTVLAEPHVFRYDDASVSEK